MKLGESLYRWKKALPGGHLWRGKYKLYKKVTPHIKALKLEELNREEQNMFYLRNPYLTPEQSKGHARPFQHFKQFLEKQKEQKLNWRENGNLGDRFGFLKVTDKWE